MIRKKLWLINWAERFCFVGEMRIPERYRAGLSLLASIPDPTYQEILEAGRRAPITFLSNRELGIWMASEVKSLTSGDIEKIIDSLTSLYRLRVRANIPIQKLTADVVLAAQESIVDFKIGEGVDFHERLASLLALESLSVVAVKAKELQRESERIFCEARIITDIRPIFGNKIGDSPEAAIIVHTLKLGYHDSETSTHKEIYIALDAEDISELKRISERAEEKARSLKVVLDAAKLRSVDLQ